MTFGLGYLMGIVVGEGSFTSGPRLSVALHECDPEPLRALMERFGGTIYGPYVTRRRDGKSTPMWQWKLGGPALWRALPVFDQYLPQSHKRSQYEAWKGAHAGWMAFHRKQEPRPRPTSGVPAREVQEARRAARRAKSAGRGMNRRALHA
jgi:hypothetical protein